MHEDSNLLECDNCLCLASRRAARAITRAFDHQLRPYGIRATQLSILAHLLLRGPRTIGELAQALSVERTTLTRNLALIEAKGWIHIHSGKDARLRVVAATKNGRAIVRRAFGGWRKAQQAVAVMIGPRGVTALHELSCSS